MTLMAFREVTITLGFWEDVPGYEKSDAEFRERVGLLFPGAHIFAKTNSFKAWEVNDELIGRAI